MVTQVTVPNGIQTRRQTRERTLYEYDSLGRLKEESLQRFSSGNWELFNITTYTYSDSTITERRFYTDGSRLRLARKDSMMLNKNGRDSMLHSVVPSYPPNRTLYSYDFANRLSGYVESVLYDGSTNWTPLEGKEYLYDANGRLTDIYHLTKYVDAPVLYPYFREELAYDRNGRHYYTRRSEWTNGQGTLWGENFLDKTNSFEPQSIVQPSSVDSNYRAIDRFREYGKNQDGDIELLYQKHFYYSDSTYDAFKLGINQISEQFEVKRSSANEWLILTANKVAHEGVLYDLQGRELSRFTFLNEFNLMLAKHRNGILILVIDGHFRKKIPHFSH